MRGKEEGVCVEAEIIKRSYRLDMYCAPLSVVTCLLGQQGSHGHSVIRRTICSNAFLGGSLWGQTYCSGFEAFPVSSTTAVGRSSPIVHFCISLIRLWAVIVGGRAGGRHRKRRSFLKFAGSMGSESLFNYKEGYISSAARQYMAFVSMYRKKENRSLDIVKFWNGAVV